MAASWPAAKKTFTQIVNGVAKLVGLLWNTGYDEIEAVQTFIGAPGAAQTHLAALLDTVKDAYTGGRCYKKDADEIYVGPFAGIIANAAGTVKKLRVSTSVTTLAAANLDTGAFAAATYYYIYATADAAATTPTFVISASASAPTGYTHYRRLGWFYNETINVIDITGQRIGSFSENAGTLVTGTPCIQNPWAQSGKTVQAHGLGAIPTMVVAYLECLTAEEGYSVGDRIDYSMWEIADSVGFVIVIDATNVTILSSPNQIHSYNKTTPAGAVILTAAKWKVVAVPYRLN